MQSLPKNFTLPFLKKEQLAKDTYSFFFDRSNEQLDYIAGQYIRMTLQIPQPDDRGISRHFSIVTPPTEKRYLAITTKIIQSTFKKALFNLSPGQVVQFFGPAGRFYLDETDTRSKVFLAGGIGITPFHSMITYSAEKKLTTPITFFASFTTMEDLVYYDELMNIAKENPHIKIIYTITHPDESQEKWNGETGRISAEMIKKYVPNITEQIYYICGPSKMNDAMAEIITGMGIPLEQIKRENFTGY